MTAKVSPPFSKRNFHITTLCVRNRQTDKRSLNWSKAQCAIFLLHNLGFSECTSFHCNLIFIKIKFAFIKLSPLCGQLPTEGQGRTIAHTLFVAGMVFTRKETGLQSQKEASRFQGSYTEPLRTEFCLCLVHTHCWRNYFFQINLFIFFPFFWVLSYTGKTEEKRRSRTAT